MQQYRTGTSLFWTNRGAHLEWLLFSTLLITLPSYGDDNSSKSQGTFKDAFTGSYKVGAGLGFFHMPDYAGSRQSTLYAIPFPYLEYIGDVLTIKDQRVQLSTLLSHRVAFGFSGYLAPPADSHPDNLRASMPDLNPLIELGPSLIVALGKKDFLEPSVDPYDGWQLTLELPLRSALAVDTDAEHHSDWLTQQGWTFNPKLT